MNKPRAPNDAVSPEMTRREIAAAARPARYVRPASAAVEEVLCACVQRVSGRVWNGENRSLSAAGRPISIGGPIRHRWRTFSKGCAHESGEFSEERVRAPHAIFAAGVSLIIDDCRVVFCGSRLVVEVYARIDGFVACELIDFRRF